MQYYQDNANTFINRTKDTPFTDMQEHFTRYLKPGARILDFGCGSGRDALAFLKNGFQTEAIDGTEAFVLHAQSLGIPSRCLLYDQFEDQNCYDGIWACASLLHLQEDELTDTLARIYQALKPGGIFYCSMKKGSFQGERNGRWFRDQTAQSLEKLLDQAGFDILEIYESLDARVEQKGQIWINAISKKNQ